MAKRVCRVCECYGARVLTVTVAARGKGAQQWRVEVCSDCWRAWEAMLDQAAFAVQPGLSVTIDGKNGWFQ